MHKVHVIVEDAATLGPMRCLDDAIDKFRGFGIRLLLIYQSLAQLKKCFPNDQDQTVLANVTQVFFAVNDYNAAQYVSNRLGETTLVVESGGSGRGFSQSFSQGGMHNNETSSSNTSQNWSQIARKLLKPEEVLGLNERLAITFVPGMPPILSQLERYYERSDKQKKYELISQKDRVCRESLLLFLLATSFLWIACFIKGNEHHARTIDRNATIHARGHSRIETRRYPGKHGIRQRPF